MRCQWLLKGEWPWRVFLTSRVTTCKCLRMMDICCTPNGVMDNRSAVVHVPISCMPWSLRSSTFSWSDRRAPVWSKSTVPVTPMNFTYRMEQNMLSRFRFISISVNSVYFRQDLALSGSTPVREEHSRRWMQLIWIHSMRRPTNTRFIGRKSLDSVLFVISMNRNEK